MPLFAVTVLYTHKDGRTVEALAIVGAPDEMEAIHIAADGVRALPHCAELIGGMCEPLGEEDSPLADDAPEPQRASDNVVPLRPRGATVH